MQVKTSDRHDYDYFHFLTDRVPRRKAMGREKPRKEKNNKNRRTSVSCKMMAVVVFCFAFSHVRQPFPIPSPPFTLHSAKLFAAGRAQRGHEGQHMPRNACSVRLSEVISHYRDIMQVSTFGISKPEEGGVGQTQSRLKTRRDA